MPQTHEAAFQSSSHANIRFSQAACYLRAMLAAGPLLSAFGVAGPVRSRLLTLKPSTTTLIAALICSGRSGQRAMIAASGHCSLLGLRYPENLCSQVVW